MGEHKDMRRVVLDTSVVIALLASDEERDVILNAIEHDTFLCSESVTAEFGNAISAMFKRDRISLEQGIEMLEGFFELDIEQIPLNLKRAIELSHSFNIYAYDAYVLECAERLNIPLVTLDERMKDIAEHAGISVIEVS